jgi:8-oxo-dGTP pyrophosphatase MutT (NUDIX family)/glycosyltransferase involved in cell wall biosynthesis
MGLPEFSIVLPVYNEAENIVQELRAIERDASGNYEILVVYDFDEDTTLPAIRAMDPPVARLRLVKNDLGRGVVNAIRKGFQASSGWLGVVVTMADLSDPPEHIPRLVAKLREGCDVVAGSRYMAGGRQFGGPWLKRTLSRLAGQSAYWLTGIGIHDVTTNFRAYSRRLASAFPIESNGGFELGLELTTKCHLNGWRVGEVPATWHDRSAGESRFRLWKWLPGYLRWYLRLLFGDPLGLSLRLRRARRARPQPADYKYFGVVDRPGYGWTANRYLLACVIVPVTAEGKVVLVRIARPCYSPDEPNWELPGGAVDPGESPSTAAARELVEETGYSTDRPGEEIEPTLEAAPGMGSMPHRIVVLRDCVPGRPTGNPSEEGITEARSFSLEETRQMSRSGQIRSLVTLGALALFEAGEQSS